MLAAQGKRKQPACIPEVRVGGVKLMLQYQLKLRMTKAQQAECARWLYHLTGVWNWAVRKIELNAQDKIYFRKKSSGTCSPVTARSWASRRTYCREFCARRMTPGNGVSRSSGANRA